MRYVGQWKQIRVNLSAEALTEGSAAVAALFEGHYKRLYGILNPEYEVEVLTWRLRVTGPTPRMNITPAHRLRKTRPVKGSRPVYFPGEGFVDTPVYDHYALQAGAIVEGPAVFEQTESTAVLPPDAFAEVDDLLNLRVALEETSNLPPRKQV
jgi:N-methylhydantoinase A/oxoprolinase/acetone carboxylase beta subunit